MTDVSEYRRQEEALDVTAPRQSVARGEGMEQELLTINFGPHHPATHGVLRLLVHLDGEVVRDLKPIIGYVHTGIEKTAEDKSYWKVVPIVERMDYLAYYFNAMAYCGAVETLVGVEVPKRAQYLRVMHLELNRIMSHLVWLGTSALDLGAISMFWYCFRERETILDLFEMSSGQRMHTRYIQVGGVIEDIPAGFAERVRAFCEVMPDRIDSYRDLLEKNEIVLQRLRNVGALGQDELLALGVTGPLLRSAGHPWDLRKAMPYSSYEDFEFKIPVGTIGDNYDRFFVRIAEMYESVKIIEQCLDGLPEGPHITEDRKVALPPRWELATSMEALIHHFKLVTEGFRVPPGEAYYPIESPRGELGCFVRSDGSSKPARVHMRDPSFVNLQATAPMVKDLYIADMIATLAALDPDPRRNRPVMAIDPTRVPRFGHGSRVPGWDEAADLTKDPEEVPDPATTPVPEELRTAIEAYMTRYPDRRSATIPALHAMQDMYGWCTPQGMEQVACVMRLTPGYVISVATFYDMFFTQPVGRHDVFVCTNISCSLRGADELFAAFDEHGGEDPELNIRAFECLGACDMAPMASIDGSYVGPIRPDEVPAVLDAVRRGEEPLPDRQLKNMKSADPRASSSS